MRNLNACHSRTSTSAASWAQYSNNRRGAREDALCSSSTSYGPSREYSGT
jgi:hypothetical protein